MKEKKIIVEDGMGPDGGPREVVVPGDHAPPVTRRDFLRLGVIPCAAKIFTPSILGWLMTQERANAAGCAVPNNDPTLPLYLEVDCNGGMSLESIFMTGKSLPAGSGSAIDRHMNNLLPASEYGYQGRTFNAVNSYRTDLFGGFPIWTESKFSQLIGNYASAADLAKCSAIAMVKESFADSTSNNPYSCAGGIASITSKLLVGTNGGVSGATKPLCAPFSASSVAISGPSALSNLYRPGNLPAALSKKIFDASASFNQGRRGVFQNLKHGLSLADSFVCGAESGSQAQSLPSLNPLDPSANPVYGSAFQCTSAADTEGALLATLGSALGNGVSSSAVYVLGGCDIHSGDIPTRISEEKAATSLARIIGGFLTLCSRLGRKGMIYLYTDGSAYTHNSTGPWYSDLNMSTPLMFFFNPAGAPQVSQFQVEKTGWQSGMSAAPSSMNYRAEVAGRVALAHWWYFWKPNDRNLTGLLPLLPSSGISLYNHLALA